MPTFTIYKRELKSYFSQPTAYAIIVVFLVLSTGLAFTLGEFMEAGQASLEWSFLVFHPALFAILAPAVGMRLWSDEQRNGTIELLGTFPLTTWSAILGKYLAAMTVWLLALLLTFPMIITVNYLGDPDNGAIASGYLGSLLICATFLAITMLVSAFTRDQVVCLIVSVTICIILVICGWTLFTRVLHQATSPTVVDIFTSIGVWDHFNALKRGMLRLQDIIWFASIIIACLLGTSAILSAKRA